MSFKKDKLAHPNEQPFQAPTAPSSARYSLSGRQSLGPSRLPRAHSNQNAPPPNDGFLFRAAPPDPKSRMSVQFDSRGSMPGGRMSTSGRKSSIGASAGMLSSAPPKDPRPIRDKSFQLESIKTLVDFLAKAGYDRPISAKILTAPSSKDFQQIFRFLYLTIDPTYEFGKKFEEEVPTLIKAIRYPYASDISKSQLFAVGSMHAWPSLLAMLVWMVELISACDDGLGGQPQDIAASSSNSEALFFDYLSRSYKGFLAGEDNFEEMASEFRHKYGSLPHIILDVKNQHVCKMVEELAVEVQELEDSLRVLSEEEAPLQKAEKERKTYAADILKFTKFIEHLKIKREKLAESLSHFGQDIAHLESELADLESQRSQLQAQVDSQDICPEDIDRMNSDKEQLVKALGSLSQLKEETSKLFWEREMLVQKKIDSIEKLVQEYNFAAERIGLIPKDAPNSNNMDFELAFNAGSSRHDTLLNLNVRDELQTWLHALMSQNLQSVREKQSQRLSLNEQLERLCEHLSDKREETLQLEEKLQKTAQVYSEEKEVAAVFLTLQAFNAENRRSSAEIESLVAEMQKIKSDMSSSYLHSQQALQKATIAYDQLCAKISDEKDRIGREIFKILEELINFKTYVEASLAELDGLLQKEAIL